MIRRPPRSTLFPTRRSSDLLSRNIGEGILDGCAQTSVALGANINLAVSRQFGRVNDFSGGFLGCHRSEEHTSELQSHLNLVCRLLLAKKKKHHDEVLSL